MISHNMISFPSFEPNKCLYTFEAICLAAKFTLLFPKDLHVIIG